MSCPSLSSRDPASELDIHLHVPQFFASAPYNQVNGKSIERGVAFPVCVSVNDVICNHSPLASEETVSSDSWLFCVCIEIG